MKFESCLNSIVQGDCLEVMKGWPDNSIDGIVTDPPYGLGFMGKEWDTFSRTSLKHYHEDHSFAGNVRPKEKSAFTTRATAAGSYDFSLAGNRQFQQWFTVWATEALRIAKPGAMMLVFGGTRTVHRLTCAIEDAGWQIRDKICWLFGSGFPKSTDISKQFDKRACREQLEKELGRKPTKEELKKAWEGFRKVVGQVKRGDVQVAKAKGVGYLADPANRNNEKCFGYGTENITTPTTHFAKLWDGYGTALKPAWEPIIVAMKPLDGTFAANAEKWSVAGLNIDGGRIGFDKTDNIIAKNPHTRTRGTEAYQTHCYGKYNPKEDFIDYTQSKGRWPANVILDEEAAAMLDEQSGMSGSSKTVKLNRKRKGFMLSGSENNIQEANAPDQYGDSGGASRFFYCAKASRAERNAGLEGVEEKKADLRSDVAAGIWKDMNAKQQNSHPTVKPLKLMEYLCTLVRPPTENPVLLDCFAGSGTTLIAAINTGWDFIGIEKEADYVEIAKRRIEYWRKKKRDELPLFGKSK